MIEKGGRHVCSISARAVTVAFGIALALRMVLGAVPADATTLPVVAPGDPISGLLAIDPTTPPATGITPPNQLWLHPGAMEVALGGQIINSPISFVDRLSDPVFGPFPIWGAVMQDGGTLNGEAIGRVGMQLNLVDTTGSTSIFPPPLTVPLFNNVIIELGCLGCGINDYTATLTTLVQVDAAGTLPSAEL
jgi:hypothetical protein